MNAKSITVPVYTVCDKRRRYPSVHFYYLAVTLMGPIIVTGEASNFVALTRLC